MWFQLEIDHFPQSSGFNFLLSGVGAWTNLYVLSGFEEQLEKEGLCVCVDLPWIGRINFGDFLDVWMS